MTDLQRARGPNRQPDDWIGMPRARFDEIVATARRQGAEEAILRAENAEATAYAWADADAYRRGAEEMRERAAQVAAKYDATSPSNVGNIHPDYFYGQENAADGIADAIRALPLTPEKPA